MTGKKPASLAIILPCYNEEEVLRNSFEILNKYLVQLQDDKKVSLESKIVFIDDGSTDLTWSIIQELSARNREATGIQLSRNFGQQNALLAGLYACQKKYDVFITLDVDLQDDPAIIPQMIDEFYRGKNIVYGVRNDRKADSFIYRRTVQTFYKTMQFLGVKSIYNHADFRLIDKKALVEFLKYEEVNLYIRGIFPEIGLEQSELYYARKERKAGSSKYSVAKLMALAWNGITSFSVKPLRLILFLGVLTFLLAIVISVWALIEFILGNTYRGWFSTIIPVTFFGGIQMISIGILGEYIGKIYLEVKGRPRFIISENLDA